MKDALWNRSWPGGQGGKPRALVAGEGWGGGVRAGWQFPLGPRLGLGGGSKGFGAGAVGGGLGGWMAVPKILERRVLGPPLGLRLGLGGGPGASVPGGVGGRGTGPRDGEQISQLAKYF